MNRIFIALLSIVALASQAEAQQAPDSWRIRATAPLQLADQGCAALNGQVYMICGYSGFSIIDTNLAYDPVSNSWTAKAACPITNFDMGVATFNGRIFTMGGYGLDLVLAYDPVSDTWTQPGDLAPMPTNRYGLACVATSNRIYAISGETINFTVTNVVEEYDPSTNTWRTGLATAPSASYAYAGLINGRIYYAGGAPTGYWTGQSTAATYVFEPSTIAAGSWTRLADMPNGGTFGGAATVIGRRLLCFGGDTASGGVATYELNVGTAPATWTRRADVPLEICYGGAATLAHKAYVAGDFYDFSDSPIFEYTPAVDGTAPTLDPATLVQKDSSGTIVAKGGAIQDGTIRIEGSTSDVPTAPSATPDRVSLEVEVCDVAGTYTNLPTAATALASPGTAVLTIGGLTLGKYKWQARVVDEFENVSPWIEFANPAFLLDPNPPSVPVQVLPSDSLLIEMVTSSDANVTFAWLASTDDSGSILKYELEASQDPSFAGVPTATSTPLTGHQLYLPDVGTWYWHVRAMDPAGNVSAWSPSRTITLVWASASTSQAPASTAQKACGMSASGSPAALLAIVALLFVAMFRRHAGVVAAVVLFATTAASAQDTWTKKRNDVRNYSGCYMQGVASTGGKLYVCGGDNFWTMLNDTMGYSPVTNTWSWLEPMPILIEGFACTSYNGTVYAFGSGWTDLPWAGGQQITGIWAYDPGTDHWSAMNARLSIGPVSYPTACALNGKIYICSGESGLMDEYDPVNDTITPKTPLPVPWQGGVMAAVNGKAYYFGGGSLAAGIQPSVWAFNPSNNDWTRCKDMLEDRYMPSVFTIGSRIYLVGGGGNSVWAATTNMEYEPGGDTWTYRSILPSYGTMQGGAATIGGKGYVHGGQGTARPELYEYTPPDFGLPPNSPTSIAQLNALGQAVSLGGWTGNLVTFEAMVTDPNTSNRVRFEVEVRRVGDPWTGTPTHSTPLSPQGLLSLTALLPAGGDYDWRYRAADEMGNYSPSLPDWMDFSPASPDFRCDVVVPTQPVQISPIGSTFPVNGRIAYTWTPATDANGILRYDVEVSLDPGFLRAPLSTGSSPTTSWSTAALAKPMVNMYWRVRAVDLAANVGAWSQPVQFFVDDGIDHAAGDAVRACGFSAGGDSTMLPALLLALVLILARGKRG